MTRIGDPRILLVIFTLGVSTAMAQPHVRDHILPRSECFFGLHFDLHPGATDTVLGKETSPENVRALLRRVDPDYVQYDCKGHAGYTGYPTDVGWTSPGIVQDALRVWRDVTWEFNTGLFIHYSGVWDTVALEHHPEWSVVNADGSRDANSVSVFGPYVDELLIPQVKEVIDRYGIDGIWADGECWAAKLDWCEEAQRRFTEETGIVEVPHQPGDPYWLEWKEFHRRAYERYLDHWVRALHEHKPGFQITSNWMYTTFAPTPMKVGLDYLSGDYSPTLSVDRARVEARYLASTGMPWDLMAWGFNWTDGTGHNLKTPEHLMQEAGVVLMQGGGFQIYNQPVRTGHVAPFMIETLGQVADFCRARQAVSFKSATVPQVAVLLSHESWKENCDGVFVSSYIEAVEGILHALLESHYSVDVLAEHQLQPRLSEFPLVVIPDAHVLPDGFRDALVEYVRAGGSLLVIHRTARLFEEELGIALGEEHHSAGELAIGDGFLSIRGPWLKAELRGATGIASWYPDRVLRPEDAQWAATVAELGAGRIAGIYGRIDVTNYHTHHPLIRRFIGEVCESLFPDPAVRLDGPPTVDLALRTTEGGKLSVHLLNTLGLPLGNRMVTGYIPPTGDLTLWVRAPEAPGRVVLQPSGQALNWRWDPAASVCTIQVPSVELHEVVVLE